MVRTLNHSPPSAWDVTSGKHSYSKLSCYVVRTLDLSPTSSQAVTSGNTFWHKITSINYKFVWQKIWRNSSLELLFHTFKIVKIPIMLTILQKNKRSKCRNPVLTLNTAHKSNINYRPRVRTPKRRLIWRVPAHYLLRRRSLRPQSRRCVVWREQPIHSINK